MGKLKFQTMYNRHEDAVYEKENVLPSMTVPQQAYTAAEIISRFKKGLSVDGGRVPEYNGEDYPLPDLRKLDLVEIHELKDQYAEQVKMINEELNRKEAQKKEEEQKAFQEYLKEKEKQKNEIVTKEAQEKNTSKNVP